MQGTNLNVVESMTVRERAEEAKRAAEELAASILKARHDREGRNPQGFDAA